MEQSHARLHFLTMKTSATATSAGVVMSINSEEQVWRTATRFAFRIVTATKPHSRRLEAEVLKPVIPWKALSLLRRQIWVDQWQLCTTVKEIHLLSNCPISSSLLGLRSSWIRISRI